MRRARRAITMNHVDEKYHGLLRILLRAGEVYVTGGSLTYSFAVLASAVVASESEKGEGGELGD